MKTRCLTVFLVVTLLACFPAAAFAEPLVSGKVLHSRTAYRAGGSYPLALSLSIKEGFHINAVKPKDPSLIPTKVEMEAKADFSITGFEFPEPESVKLSFLSEPALVYHGDFLLKARLNLPPGLAPGVYPAKLLISYQGCNNQMCLMPESTAIPVRVRVAAPGEPGKGLNREIFGK